MRETSVGCPQGEVQRRPARCCRVRPPGGRSGGRTWGDGSYPQARPQMWKSRNDPWLVRSSPKELPVCNYESRLPQAIVRARCTNLGLQGKLNSESLRSRDYRCESLYARPPPADKNAKVLRALVQAYYLHSGGKALE